MAAFLAIQMIRFYQKVVKPFCPPACRYYPSCSNYSLQAIEKYGFIKGSWLAVCRLLRCSPLFPGGYDPIPK